MRDREWSDRDWHDRFDRITLRYVKVFTVSAIVGFMLGVSWL